MGGLVRRTLTVRRAPHDLEALRDAVAAVFLEVGPPSDNATLLLARSI